MRDEALVGRILERVVRAVAVPVTLKIRTGWDPAHRNGPRIARIAEQLGVAAITVHGRTRACGYRGEAEYRTVREIKQAASIPVIANGDITSAEKAAAVLKETGADAVMVGRGAQGNPWIFRDIAHYLRTGRHADRPTLRETCQVLLDHLAQLYTFYGEPHGVRIARKHIGWYTQGKPLNTSFRHSVLQAESAARQLALIEAYFEDLAFAGAA